MAEDNAWIRSLGMLAVEADDVVTGFVARPGCFQCSL